MNNRPTQSDLELTEDLKFEEGEWRVQRVAWFIMALIIALSSLGLFGAGVMSSRTTTSADGAFKLKYNRFERYQAPSSLHFELRPADRSDARLWVSRDFMRTVKVQAVVPPPERVEPQSDGVVYSFRMPRNESLIVVFHLETEQRGSSPVRLRLNDGPILEAPRWVYP